MAALADQACGDPHCVGCAGVNCDRPHRYAPRHERLAVQEAFTRSRNVETSTCSVATAQADKESFARLGMALCAKRLERGRFLWRS